MIMYFSASGNSRFIAECAAEYTGDEVLSLNDRIKKNDDTKVYSERPYILVCPVFAWRIPKIVAE